MADDAVLRSSLLWLAAVVVVVGICTFSIKKLMATYLFGMFGIAGILLPDWEFFDRPISQWCTPITVDKLDSHIANRSPTSTRFRFYPIRLVIYTLIYGYAFWKWWMFITN